MAEHDATAKTDEPLAEAAAPVVVAAEAAGNDDASKPSASDEQQPEKTPAADGGGNDDASKPAPKKRGRKRKVDEQAAKAEEPAAPAAETHDNNNDDETESEAERQTTKRAKPAATKGKRGRPVGRPRKKEVVEESSDDDDDALLQKTEKLVEELSDEIKSKFGSIVWVKMGGYPYWPALITDPRRLADPSLIRLATKDITSRYLVRYYKSNNFAAMLFKTVEDWTDTKHDYREGYPTKDARAPKRRANLMAAIELADKDIQRPIEERMDGLLKVVKRDEEPKEAPPVVQKRKPGRPLGSKNKPKVPPPPGAEPAEPPKKPGRRGRKKKEEADAAPEASAKKPEEPEITETPAEEEEAESTAPPLSKEEIKAKVASKKAPSKKKAASAGDEKANGTAVAKKPAKAAAATGKSESVSKADIDAKRKKEIELVVPRKSVKSSDLREATEEATRKQLTGKTKEKRKDKIEYKAGNMSLFAKKMTRLNANESSKNNDELIEMLTQLFEEKIVYRSDVEHSGLAAIIAILRKATNSTVAQTASAVRRHLMQVLKDDTVLDAPPKKHKAESGAEGNAKPAKKAKVEATAEAQHTAASPEGETMKPEEDAAKSVTLAEPAKTEEPTAHASPSENPSDDVVAKVKEAAESSADEPVNPSEAVKENEAPVSASSAESPSKAEASLPTETKSVDSTPRPDPSTDKARMNCIDMLSKTLEPNGPKNVEIATQIEEQLFDRFKESNAEYIHFARKITFTLKRNARIRDRLFNGSLHALELAYASDALLKEM
ncbi:hypothetical protein ATCC90586_009343 [Pythium insidiosum]|nr:hypothetical protein ATCC90586_009343 [Pythium insidiosum]